MKNILVKGYTMKYTKETLWDRFFNRLPRTQANDLVQRLKKGASYKEIDYFAVKELEQQIEHHRRQARAAIAEYKQWRASEACRTFFDVFRQREGAHLKAHARAMASVFLDVRRDYADMMKLLMSSIANDAETKSAKSGGQDGQ